VSKKKRVIIAGGLNSNNVLNVLNKVGPLGVDVSSGVESEPGLKSEQKIIQFIRIVREYDEKKNNE
jgi:phosphoribosylanthranilate isomerase